jgi:hypothetical protein
MRRREFVLGSAARDGVAVGDGGAAVRYAGDRAAQPRDCRDRQRAPDPEDDGAGVKARLLASTIAGDTRAQRPGSGDSAAA